jgi:hypothetical protein
MSTFASTPHFAKKRSCHPDKELSLCEMLDDPIVHDVMRSDGVSRADVLAAFKRSDCRKLSLAA